MCIRDSNVTITKTQILRRIPCGDALMTVWPPCQPMWPSSIKRRALIDYSPRTLLLPNLSALCRCHKKNRARGALLISGQTSSTYSPPRPCLICSACARWLSLKFYTPSHRFSTDWWRCRCPRRTIYALSPSNNSLRGRHSHTSGSQTRRLADLATAHHRH